MKKVFLLLCGASLALGTNAQSLSRGAGMVPTAKHGIPYADAVPRERKEVNKATAPASYKWGHSTAKTTAVTITPTETFSTGTATTLPTGWTAAALTPGVTETWHWTNAAPTGTYSTGMGVMASTSASNGWMLFDSDHIGGGSSSGPLPKGTLTSPVYNCTGHTSVKLNFQNYFRNFYDTCIVMVSNDGGATFPYSYPVITNNSLSPNTSTANAVECHVNITPAAAGQANVKIRVYYGGVAGGGYAWMIDDVNLTELDPVDVGVENPSVFIYGGSNVGLVPFAMMPNELIDTLWPFIEVNNFGATAEPTAAVVGNIYAGAATTAAWTNTATVNAPVNAVDSEANFLGFTGYYNNTINTYKITQSINLTGDADLTNNADTIYYAVTDSTWSGNPFTPTGVPLAGGLYVHRAASGSTTALSYSPGTEFQMPAGKTDTLTSVSVSFQSSSVAGQIVGVQIYHFDPTITLWVYDGTTQFRALTSSDISTTSGLNYGTFLTDQVANAGYLVLNGGTNGTAYAAIVKGQANTATVVVEQGPNPGPSAVVGGLGLEDTSNNDGNSSQTFGVLHLPFADASVPFINLNFGHVPHPSSVVDILNANTVGAAYPNPSNTAFAVPFTMAQDSKVVVTLVNEIGQVVATQTVNATAGQASKATFNTTGLASGVYIYTVEANGDRTTGRISVAH